MNHQKINNEILKKLSEYLENNPEIRFCQALINLGINENVFLMDKDEMFIKDNFYEDPEVTLNKMKERK